MKVVKLLSCSETIMTLNSEIYMKETEKVDGAGSLKVQVRILSMRQPEITTKWIIQSEQQPFLQTAIMYM